MEQLRAYKYRLNPTNVQKTFLNQNFGCVRFLWNALVANFNSWSPETTPEKLNEKILKENPEYSFLRESISYALQQKRIDFDNTKSQFFNKRRKTKLGRMKFKKRGVSRESFRLPGAKVNIDLESGRLKIPKLHSIKMIVDRKFDGEVRSATISKDNLGHYYVSVLVKETPKQLPDTGKSVGIDLGLKDFLILSNGFKVANPTLFRENQAKLRRAQQHLARKQKGSNRYNKQKIKVAKIHKDITNQRNFIQHNLSKWLVENFGQIFVEDLNVKGMVKNHKLAKSISDVSWSSFVSMLDYKSHWYGKTVHKIDRFYPSSKTCSCCEHKMEKMDLSIREWTCPKCGTTHDRDLNASINILNRGLKDFYSFTSAELTEYKRGEELNPWELRFPKVSSVKRLVTKI